MNILIKNGLIVTMDEKRRVIDNGAVVAEGNRIAKVCKMEELEDQSHRGYEVIDAQGKAIFPGFINAHTHVAMQLYRGVAHDCKNALYNLVFPMERYLTADDCYVGSLLGCLEAIKSGVTCISDHYHFMDSTAKAVHEVGMRGVLAHKIVEFELFNPPHFDPVQRQAVYQYVPEEGEKGLKENMRLIRRWHTKGDGRIVCRLGPHGPDTCSMELLQKVRDLATAYEVGIFIHCSQTQMEVEHLQKCSGKTGSVEYLQDIGFLGPDVLAAHCIFVNPKEVEILARTDTKVSHNPMSNAEDGFVAPVVEMLRSGVTVGLGTDCFSMDIVEEMRHAALFSKVRCRDSIALSASQILEMATIGGARCLGLQNEIGSIEVGKKADIVIVNILTPHLVPLRDIVTSMVYSARTSDVHTVVIDGKLIMNGGVVTTIDEKSTLLRAQEVAEKWWKRSASIVTKASENRV